jgi:hypothetical protein
VRVWSAVTGECEQTLVGHSGWVYSAEVLCQQSRMPVCKPNASLYVNQIQSMSICRV